MSKAVRRDALLKLNAVKDGATFVRYLTLWCCGHLVLMYTRHMVPEVETYVICTADERVSACIQNEHTTCQSSSTSEHEPVAWTISCHDVDRGVVTATTSPCADVVSSTPFSSLSPSPSNNRFSSSASCTSNFTLASPNPSPSPPTFRPSRRLVFSTDSLTTACQVLPSFLRSAESSSLICRAAPGPWYPNAVYSCTAAAPARANSSASAPEEIPPQPIMGIDAGSSERRVRRVARV